MAREYKDRLRSRPIRPDLIQLKMKRSKIFKMKMKTKSNVEDVRYIFCNLKNNQSRDHLRYMNEIWVIGVDLKNSLLTMMNLLKKKKLIASVINVANITTVPKRGSHLEPKNERVIFRVCVFRNILMHLIYNMKYSG